MYEQLIPTGAIVLNTLHHTGNNFNTFQLHHLPTLPVRPKWKNWKKKAMIMALTLLIQRFFSEGKTPLMSVYL